jgi:hypothetical protein
MPNMYWMIDLATGKEKKCDRVSSHDGVTDYRNHHVNLTLIQDDDTRVCLNFGCDEMEGERPAGQADDSESHESGNEPEDERKQAAFDTSKDSMEPEKPLSLKNANSRKRTALEAGIGTSDKDSQDNRKAATKTMDYEEPEEPTSDPELLGHLWSTLGDFLVIRVPYWA